MLNYLTRKRIKARSIKARERALRRWAIDRQRRETLSRIDPVRFSGKVVARNVFIDERSGKVTETVFYDFDSARDWKRKLRKIKLPNNP